MKPILSKKAFLSASSFFLSFFYALSQGIFLPHDKIDTEFLPPYQSNLLQDQRTKQEQKEKQSFENIMQKVVKGDEKELKKQADVLVKDKKKLDQFLTSAQSIFGYSDKKNGFYFSYTDVYLQSVINSFYQDKQLTSKTISLHLKNAPISEAIELINKSSGLNFIIDPQVKGVVHNINLVDVSVACALKLLLSSNTPKLALIKDVGVWRILTLKDAVFFLQNNVQELYAKDFSSRSKIIYHAKWSEGFKLAVEKMWQSITVSQADKKNHYIIFDDNTKKIFFKGRKSCVNEFHQFLKSIDIKIPRVRVNVRVVIAGKDFEESFGLQVSGVYNRSASSSSGWGFTGFGPVTTPGGQGNIKEENLMDWALNLLPSTASQFLNVPFIFGGRNLDTRRLNLVLNAAESRSEIETILKPSLLVNSGEIAEILVGQEVPIETSVQERIEGSLRDVNTINYKSLGMKLKVRPVVSPDNEAVFLDIFVENSYVKGGALATTFDAKQSIIVSNRSKNRVLLKNGQTTLIGGLISNEKRREKQGIPVLQDIPFLGNLFKGSRRIKSDDQLMIFISPTIM